MAREFQRTMEQAADESGLGEASKSLNALNRLNLNSATSTARKYAGSVMTGDAPAPPAAPAAAAPADPAPAPRRLPPPTPSPEAAPDPSKS